MAGNPAYETGQSIVVMREKHGIACDLLHGSDWEKAVGDPKKTLMFMPALRERLLGQENGKQRFVQVVTDPFLGLRPLRGQRRGDGNSGRSRLFPRHPSHAEPEGVRQPEDARAD